MSAEEFWKDDPQLFVSYRTSFINKQKQKMEEEDYKSWLRGYYIYQGNGRLMMGLKKFIGNIVAGLTKGQKDNSPIDEYYSKPLSILAKEKKEEEEKKAKEDNYKQYETDLRYYGTLKKQYLEKLSKKGE